MSDQSITGNNAFALGALKAGVSLISGCPGAPSAEVLVYASQLDHLHQLPDFKVEWSTDEKSALDIAVRTAMKGARALTSMKASGLNAALDTIITLPYQSISRLVLLVTDDPGCLYSQIEQDTRQLAEFAQIPLLDPANVAEAETMIAAAFEISDNYLTPVIVRPVTRIAHGTDNIDPSINYRRPQIKELDLSPDWLALPTRSLIDRNQLVDRFYQLEELSSTAAFNIVDKTGLSPAPAHFGIVAGGISWAYLEEAIERLGYVGSIKLMKIGMPVAFPKQLALEFMRDLDELIVFEESSPVIERRLLEIVGQHRLKTRVVGRLGGTITDIGESSTTQIYQHLHDFLSVDGPGNR
jgi:indolepyruvate ferredoxin oxidoreductase alpha subunit